MRFSEELHQHLKYVMNRQEGNSKDECNIGMIKVEVNLNFRNSRLIEPIGFG